MCVILGKMSKQKKPSERLLRACWASNPHGGGIMWRKTKSSHIEVYKGLLKVSEFLKVAEAVPDNAEAWYHTRIVSRGAVCQAQCHPFILPGGSWYMHNGTFSIEPWDGMSDTQTVSEYLLKNPQEDMCDVIRGLCRESYSKAVIMTPNQATKLYGQWSEYEGYKVSNLYFTTSLIRERVKTWAKAQTLCDSCAEFGNDCYGELLGNRNDCPFYMDNEI